MTVGVHGGGRAALAGRRHGWAPAATGRTRTGGVERPLPAAACPSTRVSPALASTAPTTKHHGTLPAAALATAPPFGPLDHAVASVRTRAVAVNRVHHLDHFDLDQAAV